MTLGAVQAWFDSQRPIRPHRFGLLGASGDEIQAKVDRLLLGIPEGKRGVFIAGTDLLHAKAELWVRGPKDWKFVISTDFEYADKDLSFELAVVKTF